MLKKNLKNNLKIVSFDVDGTLVDLEYNDLIWFKEIPELVAQEKGISFIESLELVKEEYNKLGEHNLNWYDIKYWITYFDLPVSHTQILEKYEPQVKIFPEVIPVLKDLQRDFTLIIITAMPREFLIPKMKKLREYFKFAFSAISDFKNLKNSEIYSKVSKILKVHPEEILHIGDHWEFDYLAARQAGFYSLYLDRSNTKKGENIINSLEEARGIIEEID